MAEKAKIIFEEVFDQFPSEDIFDLDDSCLDQKYKELAKELFGETEEKMTILIRELKEVTKQKGIEIPGISTKGFYNGIGANRL